MYRLRRFCTVLMSPIDRWHALSTLTMIDFQKRAAIRGLKQTSNTHGAKYLTPKTPAIPARRQPRLLAWQPAPSVAALPPFTAMNRKGLTSCAPTNQNLKRPTNFNSACTGHQKLVCANRISHFCPFLFVLVAWLFGWMFGLPIR